MKRLCLSPLLQWKSIAVEATVVVSPPAANKDSREVREAARWR